MARRLLSIGAVLAMTLLSAFTLAALVVPGLWLGRTLVCLGVTVLVVALARSRSSSPGIPSLLGLAAGLLTALALYFPDHAVLRVLPTQDTVRAVLETVSTTLAQMRSSYPPITEGDGVAFFVSVGVVVVFSLAEMLAVGAWAPAWSGAAGARAVVRARAARGPRAAWRRWRWRVRRTSSSSRCRRATTRVTAVDPRRVPCAPALSWWRRCWSARSCSLRHCCGSRCPCGGIRSTSSSEPARLAWISAWGCADDLTRSTDVDLISYTGATPEQVGPLHAYTLTEFTGNEWLRGDAAVS